MYPVGSIWETTTNDNPNTLWAGTTWVKLDAGRVLVSAGTYTEDGTTYTYNLGDKGGEAKHPLTTDELAAHSHNSSCTTNGNHNHTIGHGNDVGDENALSQYIKTNHYLAVDGTNLGYTSYSGNHNHTISIANSGGNQRHENRPPYTVINRWKRTN